MAQSITVIKYKHTGEEVLRYYGTIIERGENYVKLEAVFQFDDMALGYTTFRKGDRFVEWFYSDRWYNIFRIHDVTDDHVKGWYCNFTRPAEITESTVGAEDLELDLFVYPDGEYVVLDHEDFEALDLSEEEEKAVLNALDVLTTAAAARKPPVA